MYTRCDELHICIVLRFMKKIGNGCGTRVIQFYLFVKFQKRPGMVVGLESDILNCI